jgi:hypothetical protein
MIILFIRSVVASVEGIYLKNLFISHFDAMHRLYRLEALALQPQQLKRSALNQLVQLFCHKIAPGVKCQAIEREKKDPLRDIL